MSFTLWIANCTLTSQPLLLAPESEPRTTTSTPTQLGSSSPLHPSSTPTLPLSPSPSPSLSASPLRSEPIGACETPQSSLLYLLFANTNFTSTGSLLDCLGLADLFPTPLLAPASSASSSSSSLAAESSSTPSSSSDPAMAATEEPTEQKPFDTLRSSTGGAGQQMSFNAGNPSVEVFHGEIHLFRDEPVGKLPKNARALPEKRSDLICVLALPSRMSTAEIWEWLGGYQTLVGHLRIVRDASPNKFMVLIRFVDVKSAEMFYCENNLKYFNSMEPEICHLLFIREVAFVQPKATAEPVLFRPDPSNRQLVELPDCPVCLERLDTSETGLLTSICNHTFHCSCLAKWKSDAGCPVCRYCLDQATADESCCSECERTSHLWICLICGHIGCGRYEDGHAFQHFQQTQHTFALELETQRVWDYVGDGYVHRLIQNKADGKLVEFGTPPTWDGGEGGDSEHEMAKLADRKIHDVLTEYNFLLSSQLETQRAFYEAQLQSLSDQLFQARQDNGQLRKHNSRIEQERSEMHQEHSQTMTKMARVREELGFVKQINESMRANQEMWQEKCHALEEEKRAVETSTAKQIQDFQEQVQDLLFAVETQKVINSESSSELKDGSIVIMKSPAKQAVRGRLRGRGKR